MDKRLFLDKYDEIRKLDKQELIAAYMRLYKISLDKTKLIAEIENINNPEYQDS